MTLPDENLLVKCAGCGLVHRRSRRRYAESGSRPGRFVWDCPQCGNDSWREVKEARPNAAG